MSKRRTHSPEFKARVAMEAISGRKTIQEITADHAIHPPETQCYENTDHGGERCGQHSGDATGGGQR